MSDLIDKLQVISTLQSISKVLWMPNSCIEYIFSCPTVPGSDVSEILLQYVLYE